MHNYTSTSWFYILYSSFKSSMHVWCTKVLWACGMQVEYMCMYHFVWADQREKQGYKCDASLKGGIQIICTLENDATLYIDTTKLLLIVGLNLLILNILSL